MLESATVTLSYKELQALKEKADEAEEANKIILKLEEKIENTSERKALDEILELLLATTNSAKTVKKKQEYITKCIEIYCDTFGMSIAELIEIEE